MRKFSFILLVVLQSQLGFSVAELPSFRFPDSVSSQNWIQKESLALKILLKLKGLGQLNLGSALAKAEDLRKELAPINLLMKTEDLKKIQELEDTALPHILVIPSMCKKPCELLGCDIVPTFEHSIDKSRYIPRLS